MAKVKKIFICSECGATAPKWIGKCPACEQWNTYQEEVIFRDDTPETMRPARANASLKPGTGPKPVPLGEIATGVTRRLVTADQELNRVLGGGIVSGSMVLIGGQPGIGKSTLLLQMALSLKAKVLYVSGEESEEQIKMRAERLGLAGANCFILTETNASRVLVLAEELQPDLVVIDSIQTLFVPYIDSMPGSISQVRECAGELQRFAKTSNVPVFIIGHITKDGAIAGPKLLEHIVDAVLQFEGDQNYAYRILRTLKNRFGSTDELGIYEMQAVGLREVSNPSELLLSQKEEELSGSAIGATIEGLRPMLIETQALVSKAVYGTPQRSATGFDLRRLSMLLAVLEKRGGFPMAMNDVFLNIAGGIRVDDPAIDLAIVCALISSLEDVAVPANICFAGEVGLSGEIRAVNRIEQRIQEADRLGFKAIYLSKYNIKGLDTSRYGIRIHALARIEELYTALFV
ncbi:MAG: DNA repair protein RadA [Haliscomenobacter sp.]|nr:DNA repair protein RadA [Haliscomenobacter sp.]MBP9873459.1 DNA repair protein RadA [Haliscomenobacter sp.]